MTTHSDTTATEGRRSPWFGIGKYLFIVVLVVIFFLLGQSMVRHRFFRGGQAQRNGSIGP